MKKLFSIQQLLILLLVLGACQPLFAEDNEDDSEAYRTYASSAFLQMTSKNVDALTETYRKQKDNGTAKFSAVAAAVPTVTVRVPEKTTSANNVVSISSQDVDSKLAVKVWFELTDGTCVNPTQKIWKSKERCYVHVHAAAAGYVFLFQNDPKLTSKQIYPDGEFVKKSEIIQPDQSTRLPVVFQMDDDDKDEKISLIFIRADWEGIKNAINQDEITSSNNKIQIVSSIDTTKNNAGGTLKSLNYAIQSKEELIPQTTALCFEKEDKPDTKELEGLTKSINEVSKGAKMYAVGSEIEKSGTPEDVCLYLFGKESVGQWDFTMSKQKADQ
ncbi:MAG: hypothetical protein Q4C95_10735 [Planctomycetia bacterium]|nr:hypothetical protein [Planctomycetia bacterium]